MINQRLARLRTAMHDAELEALFVSSPKNVRYISGARPMMCEIVQPLADPEYFVLIQPDRCDLLCDGRYFSGVRDLPGVTPQLLETPLTPQVIGDKIRERLTPGAKQIGFERNSLLHGDALALLEATDGLDWHGADDLITRLRVLKSPEECETLRRAQAITCDAFDHVAGIIRLGMTEHQVSRQIESYLCDHSEGNSFHPIVAFGETGSNAHYTPSPDRKLEKGQLALLDFGAIYDGYCGDLTRMICMGKADDRQREVYDLVRTAQQRCLDGVRPGMTTGSLDALCRNFFKENDCADHFIHGTGHGVGLAVHEEPRLKQRFETKTKPGMVFTVEPGLYYEGWGGVRIEDMVIVTESGCENITRTSKDLLELDV
ncbi:MAG: M24 family metallopeptidase [Phycisphaerae bacterium]